MVISSSVLCRVLNIKESDWAVLRRVIASELRGVERKRTKRGRTPSMFPVPPIIAFFDRAMPEPLSRDAIRRIWEQAEPL